MMYVDAFWMGVLVTVVVEIIALFVFATVKGAKK